ncbi:serine hydrolase domain-containing protein [Haloplasma contractile]|uniref:Esterase protein n=1 Tax=Haloplasma contractile SSD-17B TaxID=1033810 RepID=U2EEV1_9MOLU|nr:serine hydrolase domain-containing protein [Haloplasma contractile]ERJ13221.1 Putative esterase protein [Haloplasma contractile SSD-17B]
MEKCIEKRIDAIFSRWTEGVCPGGQIRVRKKGEIIYSKNFGFANLEHQVPVQDDTVFHVASVSKQITVMSILLLAEEGTIDIDDDVRKYLPDLIQFNEPVTIRNMMNNVSGIRDQWELLSLSGVRLRDTITQEDALSMIGRQKTLNFEPLSQYMYSNSNFTLLAEVVERVSGQKFDQFARQRIFKPLEMNQTQFKVAYWKIVKNRADSYSEVGTGQLIRKVLNYGTYGATSLNTTADDFLKWMEQFKKPTICTSETINAMLETPELKDGKKSVYAGGLMVGDHQGHPYIEHGGSDAAFRSQIFRFIEDDLDIIIFSNTTNIPLNKAAYQIANIVLGFENKKEECKFGPDEAYYREDLDYNSVPGFYMVDLNGYRITFKFSALDGNLYEVNQYGKIPLYHQLGNCYKLSNDWELFFGEKCCLKINEQLFDLKKLQPYKEELEGCIYEGQYESKELATTYTITKEDGLLYLTHGRNGKSLLYELKQHTFVNENGATFKIILEKNEIKGFELIGGRVKSIIFTAV